jgi:hypothetical protein
VGSILEWVATTWNIRAEAVKIHLPSFTVAVIFPSSQISISTQTTTQTNSRNSSCCSLSPLFSVYLPFRTLSLLSPPPPLQPTHICAATSSPHIIAVPMPASQLSDTANSSFTTKLFTIGKTPMHGKCLADVSVDFTGKLPATRSHQTEM